jgi:4-hydroxybenzoate polyprenyltransferase
MLPDLWGPFSIEVILYPYLLVSWAAFMASVIYKAIRKPEPAAVQEAVKHCILGLIALDALLAFLVVGWLGLAILLLLAPAWYLGKWVYST